MLSPTRSPCSQLFRWRQDHSLCASLLSHHPNHCVDWNIPLGREQSGFILLKLKVEFTHTISSSFNKPTNKISSSCVPVSSHAYSSMKDNVIGGMCHIATDLVFLLGCVLWWWYCQHSFTYAALAKSSNRSTFNSHSYANVKFRSQFLSSE